MRRPFALMIAAVTIGGLALTPAASSAPSEARTLHDPAQASSAAPTEPALIDEGGSKGKKSKKIQRTEVCFTVHNIGDPQAHQVSGTLFHQKRHTGGGTALLLQHGSVSERSVWDGASPNDTGVPTIPEQLAGAGYAVFAIDRLGYGRSPYSGSGRTLTMDSYVEMTHEIVTQIRSGTYRVTNDTCPGGSEAERPAEKVVLMGHSGGAGLTEYYATRYNDIDGIVAMVWSSHWLVEGENKWGDYFITEVVLGQLAQGKEYVYLFSVGPDGYSQPCEDFLIYPDGASADVVEQFCGPGYFGGDEPRLMPSGDIATQVSMMERIKLAIANVGPTPALLVFADKDAIFTGPQFDGGRDNITPEIQMWKERCNCDVEVLWQEKAGHGNLMHDSATEMTADVVEWLRSRGL